MVRMTRRRHEPISRYQLPDRVTRLEADLEGLTHDVRSLTHSVERIATAIGDMSKTNWPVLIGAAGLAVTIAGGITTVGGTIGAIVLNGVRSDITMRTEVVQSRFATTEEALKDLHAQLEELERRYHHPKP